MNYKNYRETQQPERPIWPIPLAIVVAGLIVSASMFYLKGGFGGPKDPASAIKAYQQKIAQEQAKVITVRPISASDHILGNPNAPVKIIQYADIECPFCKQFMGTMNRIMDEYGKDGKVAWVYRHLVDTSMHPKAVKEAEALECANELGGNAAFWKYTNRIMEVTPSHNNFDLNELSNIAKYVGLDGSALQACVDSGKYESRVKKDIDEGLKAGAEGTPFLVMISPDGERFTSNGALPYASLKNAIDLALQHHGESSPIGKKDNHGM